MAIDVTLASTGNERHRAENARRLAADAWGLAAEATVLGGWEDSDFRLRTADGSRWVLKISPPGKPRETLENQASMMHHLAASALEVPVPRVLPTRDGDLLHQAEDDTGATRWVRVLTYIEGTPLTGVADRPPRLLHEVGRNLARLDLALADFDHPTTRRTHEWDLTATPRLADLARYISDPARRELVETHLARFVERVTPRLPEVDHGVIHGDANDHNLLVRTDHDGPAFAGLIDFGDALSTATIAELALPAPTSCSTATIPAPMPRS